MLSGLFGRLRRGGGLHGPLAVAPLGDDPAPCLPAAAATEIAAEPGSRWTQARVELAEDLWGEGFLTPGGAEEILRLAVPLGLSAASSLLLLGAGAGGPPRTLATDLGVWVSAFDADPVLVRLASRRIQRAGAALAKRASVAGWSPAAPAFRRHGFHHGVAVEVLERETLAPVLAALAGAIKPGGQLVLVQSVADPRFDPAGAAEAAWRRVDPTSALPAEAEVTAALTRLGFDIRIIESQSTRHMRLVLQGWRTKLRDLRGQRPSPASAATLVAEAELWMRRIRLMHAGRIHQIRWHVMAAR